MQKILQKSVPNIQRIFKTLEDVHRQLLRNSVFIINYTKFVFVSAFCYQFQFGEQKVVHLFQAKTFL